MGPQHRRTCCAAITGEIALLCFPAIILQSNLPHAPSAVPACITHAADSRDCRGACSVHPRGARVPALQLRGGGARGAGGGSQGHSAGSKRSQDCLLRMNAAVAINDPSE